MNARRNVLVGCIALLLALCVPARSESVSSFSELQPKLLGTAVFQGERVALVETNGEQRLLGVNDVLEGFLVSDIQSGEIIFRRSEELHVLSLNKPQASSAGSNVASYTAANYKVVPTKSLASATSRLGVSGSAPRVAHSSVSLKAEPQISKSGAPKFSSPISGDVRSDFGMRKHPMGYLGLGQVFHSGVDIAAPHGTPVRAAAGGLVKEVCFDRLKGRMVLIDHGSGYTSLYAHLAKQLVEEGQKVDRGQVVGYEGSTGRSTGPHLHFEIRRNGVAQDPARYVSSLSN